VDSEIEKLFGELKRRKMLDNPLVVILSGHGEAFAEHNSFSHSTLCDGILHMPLIIHAPEGFQERKTIVRRTIDDPVGLIDVLPTILDICQVSFGRNEFQGTSLTNLMAGLNPFPRKYVLSEKPHVKGIAYSNHKLMANENKKEELYNLEEDPGETLSLLGTGIRLPN
jgi:arylsulfatase A-like enzyme